MSIARLIAYHRMLVLELRRIEQFVGSDPIAAEEAFVHISKDVERFLWRNLATDLANHEDRQDVIRVVLERLWSNRTKIEVRNLGSWWSYVARSARWCVLDRAGKPEDQELSQEIPNEDLALIDAAAQDAAKKRLLQLGADELWLGVEPDIDEFERKRRLLAAQLHYVNGRSWEEIADIVRLREPVSRELFDSWLINSAVIHELSYRSLWRPNDTAAGIVLRPSKPLGPQEVQQWWTEANLRQGEPPEAWTWNEIKVVILKFRNGLPERKIAQMTDIPLSDVELTVEKGLGHLQFVTIAKALKKAYRVGRAPSELLKSQGLWKRLVFQYCYVCDLPHRQVLEYTGPAAAVAEFSLTSGMINVWIGNRRLIDQLRRYIEHRWGQDEI